VVRVAELTDPGNAVYVYKDHVKGSTKRSMITEQVKSDVPDDKEYSLWEAQTLGLVIGVARAWSPALWPKPVPFHGERVKGYILGRVA
jgi:hypothetical protein